MCRKWLVLILTLPSLARALSRFLFSFWSGRHEEYHTPHTPPGTIVFARLTDPLPPPGALFFDISAVPTLPRQFFICLSFTDGTFFVLNTSTAVFSLRLPSLFFVFHTVPLRSSHSMFTSGLGLPKILGLNTYVLSLSKSSRTFHLPLCTRGPYDVYPGESFSCPFQSLCQVSTLPSPRFLESSTFHTLSENHPLVKYDRNDSAPWFLLWI